MTWNVNGQMTSQSWSPSYGTFFSIPAGGLQYVYSATQNNGQITQVVDTISGETISYQYDALKRLTSANSVPNSGSNPPAWTQTYQYDGFGNLTAKVLNGTTTSIAVNAATNRLSNSGYDANGNMTTGVGGTFAYDEANRIASATEVSGGAEYYGYAPDNKRIYRLKTNGQEEWTFCGAQGEKLGVYSLSGGTASRFGLYANGPNSSLRFNVWFAGRLIYQDQHPMIQDRLGTTRSNGWTGARYYPYGDELTSMPNDENKFATYFRDGFTGLDYADQRYCASAYGRFNTPDPMDQSAKPEDPSSWDRYSYVFGDPINLNDPNGLCPPGYVAATAADIGSIIETAQTYEDEGLKHANNSHFETNATHNLTAIDCSGLLAQALAGIDFGAGIFQRAKMQFTTSQVGAMFDEDSSAHIGDIINFAGHAGIVTGVDGNGNVTTFIGSQTSTGPAEVDLSTNKYWAARYKKEKPKVYKPCVPAKRSSIIDRFQGPEWWMPEPGPSEN
jgi:RHS repeat-associated protein